MVIGRKHLCESRGYSVTNSSLSSHPDLPDADKIATYGALSFLYFRSPVHNKISVERMRLNLQPAIDFGHVRVFNDEMDAPRAATTWATVSDEIDARLTAGGNLGPSEWASGPNLWIMEIIAPFEQRSGASVMYWLRKSIGPDVPAVKFNRFQPERNLRRVILCERMANGRLGARVLARSKIRND